MFNVHSSLHRIPHGNKILQFHSMEFYFVNKRIIANVNCDEYIIVQLHVRSDIT